ncbi:MAG TPA: DUF4124 domain-containing protein [Burkholderiales bacterium]|nr:DUF4124 domain-containing protein [Burkholderiales bacterium]
MKKLIALALLALAPAVSHGQLLKCVSKDGRVEYAAQCPPGTKEVQTGIKSAPGAQAPSAAPQPKSLAERDAEFRKRMLEREEARQKEEKKAAEEQERRYACESARAYLKSLQEGQRIARVDPRTGERVFLEDAQYAAEIAKAQRAVDTNCK